MQAKVKQFVTDKVKNKDGKTLDVGSFDVNGSLRNLFGDYVGVDMRSGPNVDIVANGHDLPFTDNEFDVVTCVETFEHDDDPFKTMSEIYRVLKKGGEVCIAASGINFPLHDHPSDYFRYTADGIKVLLKKFNNIQANSDGDESYGYAVKQ